ncbi:MAG TPA: S53 family peptidase [Solirubrobacteraceae bacterium]|nr:S53 family peptidase [Solirubrobacteraceae bacterium]
MIRPSRAAGIGMVAAAGLMLPASAWALPHSGARNLSSRHVCASATAGAASCDALIVTQRSGSPLHGKPGASPTTVAGYHPADLQSAYKLPSSSTGSGQTVAIVDAYNDPKAASDLATYRATFGLPKTSTCSVSGGKVVSPGGPCFLQVGQSGSPTSLPRNNASWSQEISLDLDMVSAICQNCNILLVEASSASLTNLGSAVNEAAKLGATEISNSYGGGESSSDPSYDSTYYNHPGIAITASSGDSGYGVQYPAASQYVTAVGGTTLNQAANARGWTETAWSGAGSGCSAYDPRPAWQASNPIIAAVCSRRAEADVSADADPNTGVSVYDTYSYRGASGWLVFGGTSVASPIIASVYALAGNAAAVTYGSYPYSHSSALFDVTSGSNGSCGGTALCRAGSGWDGPTGLGTPDGTGGF